MVVLWWVGRGERQLWDNSDDTLRFCGGTRGGGWEPRAQHGAMEGGTRGRPVLVTRKRSNLVGGRDSRRLPRPSGVLMGSKSGDCAYEGSKGTEA